MLYLHAPVHHDFEAGVQRLPPGRLVDHAELHPQHLGADSDGFLCNGGDILAPPEAINHIDRNGNVLEARITLLPQDLRVAGIHGNHGIAVVQHVLGRKVAGPVPVGGQPHDRDGPALAQNSAKRVDVGIVCHGFLGNRERLRAAPWADHARGTSRGAIGGPIDLPQLGAGRAVTR